jgi:hypothetical protein
MLTDFTSAASKFWMNAAQRYIDTTNDAIAKKGTGTFKADLLAENVVLTAADAVNFWAAILQIPPTPLLPTVRFTKATGTFVGQTPTELASLSIPVPTGANVTSSDLGLLGDKGNIPGAQVAIVVKNATEMAVTLNLTAEPKVGVYQGIAIQSAPKETIAYILVNVTP